MTTSIVITTTSQCKATDLKRESNDQIWTESDPIWPPQIVLGVVMVVHDRGILSFHHLVSRSTIASSSKADPGHFLSLEYVTLDSCN